MFLPVMLQTRLTWHVTIHKFSSDGPPRTLVVKRTLIHHSSLNCYFEKLYFSIRLKQIITRVPLTVSISSIWCFFKKIQLKKDAVSKWCNYEIMQFNYHAISIFRNSFKSLFEMMQFQKLCDFQKDAISKMMQFQK